MILPRLFSWQILLVLLLVSGAGAADHATAFLYHRFGDARYPSTNIGVEDFHAHLQILKDGGYQVLTLGELISRLDSGQPLPERTAALSVDDVYRSFLEEALPLLKEYGYPATLFISSSLVGGGDYLSWQEIEGLVREGFEIGNHSGRHDYLLDRAEGENRQAWLARVERDLVTAQEQFEDHLGFRPELFAYPYGEYSPELVELVRELGFRAAFGQQSGVISADQDLFTLPRFPLAGPYAAPEKFKAKLEMLPLPVEIIAPGTTLLEPPVSNPPLLKLQIDLSGLNPNSLNCFVDGGTDCNLSAVKGEKNVYQVQAGHPLQGRRSKYTITASDKSGHRWYWFSQLWVSAQR